MNSMNIAALSVKLNVASVRDVARNDVQYENDNLLCIDVASLSSRFANYICKQGGERVGCKYECRLDKIHEELKLQRMLAR